MGGILSANADVTPGELYSTAPSAQGVFAIDGLVRGMRIKEFEFYRCSDTAGVGNIVAVLKKRVAAGAVASVDTLTIVNPGASYVLSNRVVGGGSPVPETVVAGAQYWFELTLPLIDMRITGLQVKVDHL